MKRSYLEKGFTQEKLKNWRKISNKITFVDNKENTIFEDHLLLEELNKFFENTSRGLEINESLISLILIVTKLTQLKNNKQIRNHPSVLQIKIRLKNIPTYSFHEVDLSEIEWELNLINPRKPTTSNGIPLKLLKITKTNCSETLKTIINNCLIKADFSI